MHPTELALNDFVDGGLGAAERGAVEAHLRDCDECRAVVADLQDLQRAVASLAPIEPPVDGWRRVEDAIRQSSVARHQSPVQSTRGPGDRRLATAAWWLAAAVLILTTAVGLRFISDRQPDAAPAATSDEAPSAQSVEAELLQAEEHYQKAINGLEKIANAGKGTLDPKTAATLQSNLAVVDQAISESRAALRAQPASEPAQGSLLESFKAKIALLQDTVALINEMRKGNDSGAAQIVSGLKKVT